MTRFEARLEAVVKDFLETALVVDDQPRGVRTRTLGNDRSDAHASQGSRLDLSLDEPDDDHILEAPELINAFADKGILCSVVVPAKGAATDARVLKAAARADLVVLDWELHKDRGDTARRLIQLILDQDAEAGRRRLRVLAVYTGQPDLDRIMGVIAGDLALSGPAIRDGGLSLHKDGFRIVGLCKPIQENLPRHLAERQVAERDLPRRLALEFARLTDGLVPAVALAALAAIRNDAHRVLEALNRNLDIAYLGHRVASPFPREAEGHLVTLLAAEIASILDDRDVGANADISAIGDWLDDARQRKQAPLAAGSALKKPRSVSESQLETMLDLGLGLDDQLKAQRDDKFNTTILEGIRDQAAHLFTNNPQEATESSDEFGMRMAVRTVYTKPQRVLRLGTIVYRDGFFLCVQPRCDSVRIAQGQPRAFPFLPLTVAASSDAEFGFVVNDPDGSGMRRLNLRNKPQYLQMFNFAPSESRSVEARRTKAGWAFYSTRNWPYTWVAELKPEFAQRVAAELGSQLSRVGLTESELIRLSTPKSRR